MQTIDPSGNIADSDVVGVTWWWQHSDGADIAAVRQTCGRNALSEIAASIRDRDLRAAVVRVLSAFAASLNRTQRELQRDGTLSTQNALDWAQISSNRAVQEAVTDLWRLVLSRHRRPWEAERDALLAKWIDPTSPLHDMRRRLEADE